MHAIEKGKRDEHLGNRDRLDGNWWHTDFGKCDHHELAGELSHAQNHTCHFWRLVLRATDVGANRRGTSTLSN